MSGNSVLHELRAKIEIQREFVLWTDELILLMMMMMIMMMMMMMMMEMAMAMMKKFEEYLCVYIST